MEVSDISVRNITKNSAKVFWDVSDYSTGQVEYGETIAYGNFNTKETSFVYNRHEQLLRNLKAGTTYHYRVISEDAQGNKVISNDHTFKTLEVNSSTTPSTGSGGGGTLEFAYLIALFSMLMIRRKYKKSF